MTQQQGQMIGKHYVGPGVAGALSQLGQAYFAKQGQAGVDKSANAMNVYQRGVLDQLRRRRKGDSVMGDSLDSSYLTGTTGIAD